MTPERPIWHQRYRPERRLSKRSGRHTYLAQDLLTSEQVVIKLLLFGPDFDWADLKLFEREAQILQTLSHPAIPQYRDHFEISLEVRGWLANCRATESPPCTAKQSGSGSLRSRPYNLRAYFTSLHSL